MKRKSFSFQSLFWSTLQISLGAVLLFQIAHWRSQAATVTGNDPSLQPTAAIAFNNGTIPATYTPGAITTIIPGEATFFATPAATSTLPPADEVPIPQLPATPTPTPFVAPDYLKRSVSIHSLSAPPKSTECGESGFVFSSQFPSAMWGSGIDYHAYLPPCYGHDGRVYPVLYLMHGSGHEDNQWVHLGVAQHMDQGILEDRYPPFIVVMPDSGPWGDATSGGERSVEGVVVQDLIPWVDANLCSWATKEGRSIGGISRGGYWALMVSFRHTELFAAVSGHSSHLRLETDPPEYNPLSTFANADLSSLRIWLDWGETDFLRPGQEQLHESLMNAGIPHRVKISPGGHANYYWFEHVREYLDWHSETFPMARETYPPCQQ